MTEAPFTEEHLLARCEEVGECLEWQNTFRAKRWPVIASRRDWDGTGQSTNRQFYVRHLFYWLKMGKPPELGHYKALVPVVCNNFRCVHPDHQRIVSRIEVGKRASRSGKYASPLKAAKIAERARQRSRLSDEDVQEIRYSGDKVKAIADRYGISQAYVYMIRNGEWRKEYRNPYAALMASNDTSREAA